MSVPLQASNARRVHGSGLWTQRGIDAGSHFVDVETSADRHQAVRTRRRERGRDVHRRTDEVDDVAAHVFAVADRHRSLEPIHTCRWLLEEVNENTGVDAAVTGRSDRGGVYVV